MPTLRQKRRLAEPSLSIGKRQGAQRMRADRAAGSTPERREMRPRMAAPSVRARSAAGRPTRGAESRRSAADARESRWLSAHLEQRNLRHGDGCARECLLLRSKSFVIPGGWGSAIRPRQRCSGSTGRRVPGDRRCGNWEPRSRFRSAPRRRFARALEREHRAPPEARARCCVRAFSIVARESLHCVPIINGILCSRIEGLRFSR